MSNDMSCGEPWEMTGYAMVRSAVCISFCAGVPSVYLKPGGLLASFKPLADGSVTDCITMQDTIEKLTTEVSRLRVENEQFRTRIELENKSNNLAADAIERLEAQLKDAKEAIKLLKASVATKELVIDTLRDELNRYCRSEI
jgi:cell division protein FtsB